MSQDILVSANNVSVDSFYPQEPSCPFRETCGLPLSEELIQSVHMERRIKEDQARPLGPFVFTTGSVVALWSLRVYLVFMVLLLVWRLLG